MDCVDPDDATLKAAYAAATARLQVAAAEAAISRALVGTYSDNAEFGPIRTALEDHEPIMRAALTGPVIYTHPFAPSCAQIAEKASGLLSKKTRSSLCLQMIGAKSAVRISRQERYAARKTSGGK